MMDAPREATPAPSAAQRLGFTLAALLLIAAIAWVFVSNRRGACEEGTFCVVAGDTAIWRLGVARSVDGMLRVEGVSGALHLEGGQTRGLGLSGEGSGAWGTTIERSGVRVAGIDVSAIEAPAVAVVRVHVPDDASLVGREGTARLELAIAYPDLVGADDAVTRTAPGDRSFRETRETVPFETRVRVMEEWPRRIPPIVYLPLSVLAVVAVLAAVGSWLPDEPAGEAG
jgi:hypothetical protein